MAIVEIQRRSIAYAITACGVVLLHAYLCYPAAISRGHPPIQLFDFIAIFVAPFGMLVPTLFDNFSNDTKARLKRMALVAAGFCIIWGIVGTNLSSPCPHIGHLGGVSGILISPWIIEVVIRAVFYYLPTLLFFYCL